MENTLEREAAMRDGHDGDAGAVASQSRTSGQEGGEGQTAGRTRARRGGRWSRG
jgi:hypothetical protein